MPEAYRHRSEKANRGKTNFVTFAGANTATGDGTKAVKLQDITDGASQTIMIATTQATIPWTSPEDPIFDAAKPLPKFGGIYKKGFYVALVDGSTKLIPADISDETLKALITRNGAEADIQAVPQRDSAK